MDQRHMEREESATMERVASKRSLMIPRAVRKTPMTNTMTLPLMTKKMATHLKRRSESAREIEGGVTTGCLLEPKMIAWL